MDFDPVAGQGGREVGCRLAVQAALERVGDGADNAGSSSPQGRAATAAAWLPATSSHSLWSACSIVATGVSFDTVVEDRDRADRPAGIPAGAPVGGNRTGTGPPWPSQCPAGVPVRGNLTGTGPPWPSRLRPGVAAIRCVPMGGNLTGRFSEPAYPSTTLTSTTAGLVLRPSGTLLLRRLPWLWKQAAPEEIALVDLSPLARARRRHGAEQPRMPHHRPARRLPLGHPGGGLATSTLGDRPAPFSRPAGQAACGDAPPPRPAAGPPRRRAGRGGGAECHRGSRSPATHAAAPRPAPAAQHLDGPIAMSVTPVIDKPVHHSQHPNRYHQPPRPGRVPPTRRQHSTTRRNDQSPGHTLAGSPPGHLRARPGAPPDLRLAAARLVQQSCERQGIPERVSDAGVLARVAILLRREGAR
jgi:hypothetical protein